ncbi:MAG TPA: FAD-linked oxidase C-terminal domain-containing protein [Solirubrobacteraceae bacterium]|nr:FAD-linked oxidase C-terminal domain-containing protein [Solirubrobacteraceae bacterium]
MASAESALLADLRSLLRDDQAQPPSAPYLHDATEWRGIVGRADAVVLPESTEDVRRVLAWCERHAVEVTPRGGGTGLAGGAVPIDGGVVLALERMREVRAFDPQLWRINVEAGLRTAELHRLARENGLLFAPDPGASEQSQIGGNIATNAGGPHAYKYGTTRAWVSGIEAVLANGEAITLGGWARKDVAGYDLLGLLVGSEGTLAVITAAWLKLLPAPEAVLPLVALYPDTRSGCAAIERVIGSGLRVATLDYLDAGSIVAARAGFPGELPAQPGLMVIAEADGSAEEAARLRDETRDALAPDALGFHAPASRAEIDALWRWRDGVGVQIAARRGGKVSEDIVVPVERLAEAIEQTLAIGERHGLEALSWGHAGDGNLHSSFLLEPTDRAAVERGERAAQELFALAVELGGAVCGEHGIGWVKRGQLARQWPPAALALHDAIKHAFDPNGLLNPGKKPGMLAPPI